MKSALRILTALAVTVAVVSACFGSHENRDPAVPTNLSTADIAVGMSVRDFGAIFPGAKIPATGQWTRPDEIHGLRGEWTYSFYRNRLSWFVFNSYESNVTVTTFREYLDATRKAIDSFTQDYGRPSETVRGVLEFKDPRAGYPGYPVLKASWSTGSENLRIDYSVLGNTQERPQLLFTVEVRR